MHAGTDERVDDGITVAQREDLTNVTVVEQAQCRRSPCLGAQHASSVSADGPGAASGRSFLPFVAGCPGRLLGQDCGEGFCSARQVALTSPAPCGTDPS